MEMGNDDNNHRGRIQVQGKDMKPELSRSWSQNKPMSKKSALKLTQQLEKECNTSQLELRDTAFQKAKSYIEKNVISSFIKKSFRNRNLPPKHSDARVDIDVLKGTSFTGSVS